MHHLLPMCRVCIGTELILGVRAFCYFFFFNSLLVRIFRRYGHDFYVEFFLNFFIRHARLEAFAATRTNKILSVYQTHLRGASHIRYSSTDRVSVNRSCNLHLSSQKPRIRCFFLLFYTYFAGITMHTV